MAETKSTTSGSKNRPRSKAFLRIDLDNAYARLGVSPLAPLDEISARINELRGKARKQAIARAKRGFGEEAEEIARLDRIYNEIGNIKSRNAYDEAHPQNILLTVQPSPAEQAWSKHHKAALISEWLSGELGEEAFVPSLRCLKLWAPGGVEEELSTFLSRFARGDDSVAERAEQTALSGDSSSALRVSPGDLDRLIKENDNV